MLASGARGETIDAGYVTFFLSIMSTCATCPPQVRAVPARRGRGEKPATRDTSPFLSADVRARRNQAVPAPQVRVGDEKRKNRQRGIRHFFSSADVRARGKQAVPVRLTRSLFLYYNVGTLVVHITEERRNP